MPVACVKTGSKWRVVENSGRLARNSAGSPVDGDGHSSSAACRAQAQAINANSKGETSSSKGMLLGDAVESVLKATGIAALASRMLPEDCGCERRKIALNEAHKRLKGNAIPRVTIGPDGRVKSLPPERT